MRYEAVLFDFDYTLGDATEAIYDGFCYGFAQMGYPKPELEAVRATVGHILQDEFTMLTGNDDPEDRETFRRIFRARTVPTQPQKTKLCPGAEELVRALKAAGAKVGIVTTKNKSTLDAILDYKGLLELMDFTIGGELVQRPKPDPEGLNTAVATLGVEKVRTLFCGDTTIDASAARNAGVDFCAVLNGTTGAEAFEAFPHVFVAEGLPQLQAYLGL